MKLSDFFKSSRRQEPLKTAPDVGPRPTQTLTKETNAVSKYPLEARPGPPERFPGEMLGTSYRVLSVHRGGMGLVYVVQDLNSLKRGISLRLALKTFQARYLWDKSVLQRFEREALQWVNLSPHQNIVRALLVQQIEGRPYIWLEYVDGGSLADRLARGPIPVAEAVDLALQFVKGMRHAHEEHGLIHRDIKPANTLLTKDNVVKISDFGLSKLRADILSDIDGIKAELYRGIPVSAAAAGLTIPGALVGTPAYIPPEAILDPSSVDGRGDIYSFGMMFHEMLTGRLMFQGPDLLAQQIRSRPAPPSASIPLIPASLDAIVLKCVEKVPGDRYQSFADLEAALTAAAASLDGWIPRPASPQSIIPRKDELFMRAFTLMEFKKSEEAIRTFEEVLVLDPTEAEAYNNIAVCLADLGRVDEAVEYCKKAVAIRPDYPESWANLGGFNAHLKRYLEGLSASDRAVALKSDWAEAHSNRGANLIGLGRFREALISFKCALETDPGYWKAHIRMAEALACSGAGPDRVLDSIEKALEVQPRDAQAHAIAAGCWLDLGDREMAERHLNIALELDPANPFVVSVKDIISKKL